MPSTRSLTLNCALAGLLLAGCSGGTRAGGGPGAETRALTGAHTRIVWVQGDGTDPNAEGDQLVLMGLDTDDGRGERVIMAERRSYVKPLFPPRGDRIVFSSRAVPGPPETFIVNWDGSGFRKLADGFALDLWENPADGSGWVYLGTGNEQWNFATVERFPIDAPDRRELVWNKTMVSMDTFDVSPDGRHAGGGFPWPEAGVARLPNGDVTKYGEGCWTSLTSARGPLFWYFDGAHRNVTLVDVHTERRWMVNFNAAPGFGGAEVNHPRWANHPRFMVLSGPYNQGGANQARTGGTQAEIHVGRFGADFTSVEAWARVTNNSGGDSYPDIWIDAAASPHARRPPGALGPADAQTKAAAGDAPTPGEAARLVADVRLVRAGPIPTPEAILPYRHALVVNEYEIVNVVEGTYTERQILVAQWVIRDGRVLADARRFPGTAFRLTVERYDAHGELEGERLISDGTSTLPLYYDIGRP